MQTIAVEAEHSRWFQRDPPCPSSSVLLLPPFQGLQQPPRFTHQCRLHTFVGLPACHCYWAAGKFYELFKSPLCCCQILPPPASPSHNWTVSVNCVNSPSHWTSLHPAPHWAHRPANTKADKFDLLTVSWIQSCLPAPIAMSLFQAIRIPRTPPSVTTTSRSLVSHCGHTGICKIWM